MSSRPHDPERPPDPEPDELDWIDRLSVERRRRAREWQEAFGGGRRLAPDGGAGEGDATPRRSRPDSDTSFFDQDDPEPPRRSRRREGRSPTPRGGLYDQDEEENDP